jgi:hypothetical protein
MRKYVLAASSLLAVPSLALPGLAQEIPPNRVDLAAQEAAFAAFQNTHGGQWIAQWHPATGTPSAIYGTGLKIDDWRENSLVEARRHALALLEQNRDLLGLGDSTWTEQLSGRMGRTWSFTFEQSFRGVPALGGRADVRINMKGVVAMLGSKAWPIPAKFDVTPALDSAVAVAAAWDALSQAPTGVPQPVQPKEPRLVIWGDMDAATLATPTLCWEVSVSNVDQSGQGPIGRYYVDAKTGAVLTFVSDKHDCGFVSCNGVTPHDAGAPSQPESAAMPVPTTVTLMAWTRTGNDAYSALVNAPLPGVVLNVPGVGFVTTDLNGQFTIDINAPVTINVGALDGRHHAPITGADAPTASVLVNPGVPTTIQLSSSGATTNEAAHSTTSYWVDRTNEFCRAILGNSSQLATASNIATRVNIASTCNAYYTGNSINFYQQGGGCANTAFSTVVAHEWGHGIDDRYGGISNTNAEGMSEGWGDIIGMYLVDSPLLGSGFQTAGVALRRGDNTFVWPYSAGSPHAAGQVWMGFAWRLRENLRTSLGTQQALAISNDIVISTLVANASTRVDGVREVFIADDDDGNLLNGVPHYAELSAAATTKGIPYPQIVLATITHAPLLSTTERLTPRTVFATVAPTSGTINQVRLVFNSGAGATTRTMQPAGLPNAYLALLPGLSNGAMSYHIEATHSTGTVVRLPETGSFTYSIDGGNFATFYNEGFETGAPGWTSGAYSGTNDWQLGSPAGKSGTSSGVFWQDPSSAASGSNCYGNDLGNGNFNGRYPASVNTWLRSPVINCSGKTGVRVRFKRWLSVEQAQYDQAGLYMNGQLVWQNPTVGNIQDTAWQTVEYALPGADNNPSVQLEWRLTTDAGLHMGGWHIDDVEVGETVIVNVDAELTMTPDQVVQGNAVLVRVFTPGGSRPFLLGVGENAGPTIVPGIPTLQIGGNIDIVSGTTGPTGDFLFGFTAPPVPSSLGLLFHSQVLTLDATFTQFVVSNRFLTFITQN